MNDAIAETSEKSPHHVAEAVRAIEWQSMPGVLDLLHVEARVDAA